MGIDWKRKLSSRKLWVLITSLITTLLILFKLSEAEIAQIVAVVGAFASVITYILAEASIDVAAVKKEETVTNIYRD